MPKPNQIYRHYKGNTYRILAIAKHTEAWEDLVIYQDLADANKIWARPLTMFEDTLNDGTNRFELQEPKK